MTTLHLLPQSMSNCLRPPHIFFSPTTAVPDAVWPGRKAPGFQASPTTNGFGRTQEAALLICPGLRCLATSVVHLFVLLRNPAVCSVWLTLATHPSPVRFLALFVWISPIHILYFNNISSSQFHMLTHSWRSSYVLSEHCIFAFLQLAQS